LKFYYVIVNFSDQKFAKSRNFISLNTEKIKTIKYFIVFLNFDMAKGGASDLCPYDVKAKRKYAKIN